MLLDKNTKLLSLARRMSELACARDVRAYFVGGMVRDLLLERLNEDVDVVIEGDGLGFAQALADDLEGQVVCYQAFQTATITYGGNNHIDISTSRREVYPHSGALPVIEPNCLKEDLFRRDFTINAIALSLNEDDLGQLIDPFGGQDDLTQQTVRILHDQSFIDDPTRILRAIRFAQRLNFDISKETLNKLKQALQKGVVNNVSWNRYFSEFKKILKEDDPNKSIAFLNNIHGLNFLSKNFQWDQCAFERIQNTIKGIDDDKALGWKNEVWFMYFLALFENLESVGQGELLRKSGFSKKEKNALKHFSLCDEIGDSLTSKNISSSYIYQRLQSIPEELIRYIYISNEDHVVRERIYQYLTETKYVALAITGDDLKSIKNVSGAQVGEILRKVLYLKIDQKVKTKQDELDAVAQMMNQIDGA